MAFALKQFHQINAVDGLVAPLCSGTVVIAQKGRHSAAEKARAFPAMLE
jgi:hypothetical protein